MGAWPGPDCAWAGVTSPSPEGDVAPAAPPAPEMALVSAVGPCRYQHMTAVSPGPHAEYRRMDDSLPRHPGAAPEQGSAQVALYQI
ncbi:hypothetical protein GCM10010297_64420 [Streptomyces malachitofuscus]|nr:hypothetical protein GCM10010297_64420 [Streptomyces malachitofuscus]